MKKTYEELQKVNMSIEVKASRLLLHYSNSNEKIGGIIDVTQLYHFFKDFFKANKKNLK